jgi:hypothetical protein
MKDEIKIYHVKHDFGRTEITPPEGGFPIKLNINMTFQTFLFLLTLILVSKITGG